jgi:hypothetical protein
MSQAGIPRTGEPQLSNLSRCRRPSSTQLAPNPRGRDETRRDGAVPQNLTRASNGCECRTWYILLLSAIAALLLIALRGQEVGLPGAVLGTNISASRPIIGDGPWLFGLVADLDEESAREWRGSENVQVPPRGSKPNVWVSMYKRGEFRMEREGQLSLTWIDESTLLGNESNHGRGMELSDLIWFRGKLLTPDDRIGALYELVSPFGGLKHEHTEARGRYRDSSPHVRKIADLNVSCRNSFHEPFKAEWMVVKDGSLLVGGHGRERTKAGDGRNVVSRLPMWVIGIAGHWNIRSFDWTTQYNALRKVAGVPFPGYLLHEAWLWSALRREWIILPRRVSAAPYDARDVEHRGAKVVFTANEDFSAIRRLWAPGSGWRARVFCCCIRSWNRRAVDSGSSHN